MENLANKIVKVLKNQMGDVPTLKQLALVRTAATIWDQDATRETAFKKGTMYLENLDALQDKRLKWREIESIMLKQISCLPELLKQDVMDLAIPMTLQILDWISYHFQNSKLEIGMPKQFSWTWQGYLDKKRTAKSILKNETLCIQKRYRIACIYCLEEEIHTLWKQMQSKEKYIFLRKYKRHRIKEPKLVYFWSDQMRNAPACQRTYEKLLREAIADGNVAATEYFLQKQLFSRKQELLFQGLEDLNKCEGRITRRSYSFSTKDRREVWLKLISEMEIKHLVHILEKEPYDLLIHFLCKQRQFFIEIATYLWNFLPKPCFADLLEEILHNYHIGYTSVDYRKLFIDFWKQSPGDYKRFVNMETNNGLELLIVLIKYELPLISKARTYKLKNGRFCKLLKNINSRPPSGFDEDKWKFLKILIAARISTKHSLLQYKALLTATRQYIEDKKVWDQLFDLLDRILSD